jgi:hypothetical protein
MFRLLNASIALLVACALVGAAMSRADDPPPAPPRDDALDRLLERLEKADPPPADAKPQSEPAKGEAAKPGAEPKAEAEGGKKSADPLAPKDQALDNLLERLGQSKDTPDAPDDRRAARPPMPGEEGKEQTPEKAGEPRPPDLTGKSKDLDKHLEDLTGRRRKRRNTEDEEGSGPLSQVIREMREVEQRLGQPDTGEETRKKQTEIVKNLEQLIEQLRNSSSQSRGLRVRVVSQPGRPGQPQGGTAGANAGGASATKPARPEGSHAPVGGKDVWGHLPDELRQEMDNIAKETMLPSKEELIRRYYLSVSKKSLTREE